MRAACVAIVCAFKRSYFCAAPWIAPRSVECPPAPRRRCIACTPLLRSSTAAMGGRALADPASSDLHFSTWPRDSPGGSLKKRTCFAAMSTHGMTGKAEGCGEGNKAGKGKRTGEGGPGDAAEGRRAPIFDKTFFRWVAVRRSNSCIYAKSRTSSPEQMKGTLLAIEKLKKMIRDVCGGSGYHPCLGFVPMQPINLSHRIFDTHTRTKPGKVCIRLCLLTKLEASSAPACMTPESSVTQQQMPMHRRRVTGSEPGHCVAAMDRYEDTRVMPERCCISFSGQRAIRSGLEGGGTATCCMHLVVLNDYTPRCSVARAFERLEFPHLRCCSSARLHQNQKKVAVLCFVQHT